MNNSISFPVMRDGKTIANIFLTRREAVIDVEYKATKKCKLDNDDVWNAVMHTTCTQKYNDVLKSLGVSSEDFTLYGVQTLDDGRYNFGKYALPKEVKMEYTQILHHGEHIADMDVRKVGENLEVYYRERAIGEVGRNDVVHSVVLYQCDVVFKDILEREKVSVLSYEYIDSMSNEEEWKLCARYAALTDEEIAAILKANTPKDEAVAEEAATAQADFESKLEFEIEMGPEVPESRFGWKSKLLMGLAVAGAVAAVAYTLTKK